MRTKRLLPGLNYFGTNTHTRVERRARDVKLGQTNDQ